MMADFDREMAVQLGEFLRKKREERKIDLSKVGEATFISLFYLEALEKGEWDKLPGRTYASGYLKIYSRFLGLDSQELLALFHRAYGEKKERITLVPEKKPSSRGKRTLRLLVTTFAILVVLFVVVLLSYRLPIFSKLTPGEEAAQSVVEENIVQGDVVPSPAAIPEFAVVVVLQPENLSWVEVRSGNALMFSGILVSGKNYVFKSNAPIEISGQDGDRVKVTMNGDDLGYLTSEKGNFQRTFAP